MDQLYIVLIDGDELHFKSEPVQTQNNTISFTGVQEGQEERRKVTIHQSNISYFRLFKPCSNGCTQSDDFYVHLKNGRTMTMVKGETSVSGDYLVVDTQSDTTFIPMKNIKYHEEF